MVTSSEHSSPSKTHARLSECDTDHLFHPNQPITTEWSLHSGATGTGGGCSVSGLAGKIDVHVSAISPPTAYMQ